MGLDFLRKAGPTFEKGWDRGVRAITSTDLFTRRPDASIWVAKVRPVGGCDFTEGGTYAVREIGDRVEVFENTRLVGRDELPPPGLIDSLRRSGGVALGVVRRVSSLTGVVEMDIRGVE